MDCQPLRNRSRWFLDFSPKTRGTGSPIDQVRGPPGYFASSTYLHAEANRQPDPFLKAKHSWNIALGPIKQIPMNLFIMYISGNTISIFPIMMVVMMAVRPVKALLSVNATFGDLNAADGLSNIGQKFVLVLGNLINIALAMYKCHSMRLLPRHASDWLAFANPVERVEWAYT